MEKKVLLTELADRGTHLRKKITPTAVVTDNGQYPAGMFWDANKTLNEIVDGATDAQNTLKEIEDKLNQEITNARNAEEAITNRIDDVLGIDAEDIDNLKEVIEDLNSDTGVLSIINNKADKEDLDLLKDDISVDVAVEDANGHDYVEIAGIKWATMNIGAQDVYDLGSYFAWGETTGYANNQIGSGDGLKYFGWDNYKYGNGTNEPPKVTLDTPSHVDIDLSKYNRTDNLVTLEDSDDAARTVWSGSWRMPTINEFQALIDATTSAWTSNYNYSGVAGVVLTSKEDNSVKLFFPAAGTAGTNGVHGASGYDRYGKYWSSSTNAVAGGGFSSTFEFNNNQTISDAEFRYSGLSIRGVLGTVQQKVVGSTILDEERESWNAKANESDLGGLAFKDEATGLVYANGYNSSSNVTFGTASVDVLTGIFGSREPSFTEGAFNTGTLPSLGNATTSSFATEGVIATVDQPNETVTFTSASTANAVTAQGTFNAGTLPSKAADTFDPGAPGLARSQSVISAIFDATAEAQVWTPSAATVTVS